MIQKPKFWRVIVVKSNGEEDRYFFDSGYPIDWWLESMRRIHTHATITCAGVDKAPSMSGLR